MLVDEMPIASFQAPPFQAPGTRRAAREQAAARTGQQVFNIRVALSAGCHADSGALVRRMYAWRGYAFDGGEGSFDKVTLYAETGGELVGTMSLCLDRGGALPADENFGDRLDILRREGRRLCEPSRLAIDSGMSKRVFAALIHISYLYAGELHGFTDYVIEVNPRHVAFYQRMLGFADFGGERPCSRVGAPAVLLRLPLDQMGAQIRKWAGSFEQQGGERSFYPWFFPVWDEPGISTRLAALCRGGERA
ncbi:long-chain N-acyl amino acid synthase [Massilia sp. CMS3.1]|uniref:N-acyl amino acid synthase FeeM domain-containing protein n=1 Tax=Massilia sp. CMS3.1 TaxID=3373083 RepID=UPI003EE64516